MGITLPTDTTEALMAIHDASGVEQESLINQFLQSRWEQFEKMAYQACRRSGRNPSVYGDDVASLMAVEAWNVVKKLVDAGPDEIQKKETNFNYMIRWAVGNAVTSFFHSEAGGMPASGMSTYLLRRAQINKTIEEAAAREMPEPSRAEIIEHTNARLLATRANPSDVLISEKDFQSYSSMEFIPEVVDTELGYENMSYQQEYLLHPTEGPKIFLDTIAAAKEVNESLGLVAEIWLGELYASKGGTVKQTSIVERTGLPKHTVSRYISRIKQIALGQLENQMSESDFD